MKALWRYDNGILTFKDIEEPQLQKPGDVKIKVKYSTIGIQDLRMYREWDFYAKPGIAGYEMSGIIVELGEAAKQEGFFVGQRVTGTIAKFCGKCIYCQSGEENNCLEITSNSGTICDYVVWDKNQIVPFDANMSFAKGCLLEPVAVVYRAAKKADISPGDNVCIFGGDFNGLLMLQFAKRAGAKTVTIIEHKEENQALAYKLGADYVVNSKEETYKTDLMKISDFIGFQSVIITASNPEWLDSATNLVARGGTVMIMVYYDKGKEVSINSIKFFTMNINITSSFLYSKKELVDTLSLMNTLHLEELIHSEYPIKDALLAYDAEQKHLYTRIGLIMN